MKKLLMTVAAVMFAVVTLYAQDAQQILKRYMKETNLESFIANKEQSIMIDMSMSVNQGGQSLEIPTKSVMQMPGNKMNIQMSMMGQDINIVVNGDKGWMKAQGQVQEVPASQLSQMTNQANVMESFVWNEDKYTTEFVGEKDGIQTIKVISKDAAAPVKEQMVNFDASTGLLKSVTMTMQGAPMTMNVVEYKKFGELNMPAKMEVSANGVVVSTIIIKAFETDYPTAEFMFAEPK